jgi:hypothetical protein
LYSYLGHKLVSEMSFLECFGRDARIKAKISNERITEWKESWKNDKEFKCESPNIVPSTMLCEYRTK